MLAATTRTAVRAGVVPEAAPAGEAAAAGPVCQQVGGALLGAPCFQAPGGMIAFRGYGSVCCVLLQCPARTQA